MHQELQAQPQPSLGKLRYLISIQESHRVPQPPPGHSSTALSPQPLQLEGAFPCTSPKCLFVMISGVFCYVIVNLSISRTKE